MVGNVGFFIGLPSLDGPEITFGGGGRYVVSGQYILNSLHTRIPGGGEEPGIKRHVMSPVMVLSFKTIVARAE